MPLVRYSFTLLAALSLLAVSLGCTDLASPPPSGPAPGTNPQVLDTETGSGSLTAPPPETAKQ